MFIRESSREQTQNFDLPESLSRGDIKAHRTNMIGLYIGSILIAGAFAFVTRPHVA
jgi:hypothetical protein